MTLGTQKTKHDTLQLADDELLAVIGLGLARHGTRHNPGEMELLLQAAFNVLDRRGYDPEWTRLRVAELLSYTD